MAAASGLANPRVAPLWGELRYSGELLRLLVDRELHAGRRRRGAPAVLLIPGFMAGDASLAVLRGWLRRRGHEVRMSGMLVNMDCAERAMGRLHAQLRAFSRDGERRAAVARWPAAWPCAIPKRCAGWSCWARRCAIRWRSRDRC